jgi:hypothetical protein
MEGRIGYARASIREVKVPYRPRLNTVVGRVTATILLQQIVYHWENKGGKPFYKFRAECSHDLYVAGDSWTEELNFTPSEFDTAIRTIGTKIKAGDSKGEAFSGEDICNLVIYWTDSGRVTWYDLNVELFDKMTDPLYEPKANSGIPNYQIQESRITESRNPNLPIPETPKTAKDLAASPPDDFSIQVYYNDKSFVAAVGRVRTGPWSVICDSCGDSVLIDSLDTPTECLCGMHEYTLLSKKPQKKVLKKPESVEVYYAIAKSKGVRYGSQDRGLEEKIEGTVTDISLWRQVVVEYIAQGWSALNITTMLQYYEEHRLPGTRKGEEGGGETTVSEPVDYQPEVPVFDDMEEWAASLEPPPGRGNDV